MANKKVTTFLISVVSYVKKNIVNHWGFPIFIIGIALTLAVASSWNDSLIVDEVPHIGAGYSYIVKHDMRLNPEHPPLVKDLAGIALSFLNLNQDAFDTTNWKKDINGQWEFGRSLIYLTGNNADTMTRVARFPILVFFIIAAVLIFIWGRRLFGETGAAIALILFCFSPTVLAHARFVTTDMGVLTAILASTFAFISYVREPTWKKFFIVAIVFGLALLTKFSAFLLVPFLGLLAVLWGYLHGKNIWARIRSALRWGCMSVAVFATGFLLMTWPVYIYHTWSYPPERQLNDTSFLLTSFSNRTIANAVVWMADKPVLRSASWYATGLLMATQRAGGGNTITFLGRVVEQGGRTYFPLVYLIKEPLSWWILVFIAVMIVAVRNAQKRMFSWKYIDTWLKKNFDISAMIVWLIIYWIVSIRSPLNIGVRHILPTFPFAILLVAGQISYFIEHLKKHEARELRIFSLLIIGLLAWGIFEQARIFPSYLSYFNQLAGGPSRGRDIVTDSNLDWGQDLKRLGTFVRQNNIQHIQLDYFGWADPSYYLDTSFTTLHDDVYLDARDFLRHNPRGGWIAVSATFFEHSISRNSGIGYAWLNAYKPTASIGNSLLVWHITPRK
jgi:hypothetical protein